MSHSHVAVHCKHVRLHVNHYAAATAAMAVHWVKQSYKPEFNDRYKLKRRSDFNATALLKAVALVENQRYICADIRNNKLCEYDVSDRVQPPAKLAP